MQLIPKPVYARYVNRLKVEGIPGEYHQEYLKWLRYYLDFCDKYIVVHEQAERIRSCFMCRWCFRGRRSTAS